MALLRLLRSHLATYRTFLTAVVVLQFVGVVAMLYLPSLNADIIDNGIATGDTGYILRVGGVMLAVSLVQIVCAVSAVWFGARTAMGFGRDLRARAVPPGRQLLHPRGPAVRGAVADHPDHQRRPAGADAGADGLHDGGLRADHDGRRRADGAARGHGPRLDPRRRGAGAVPHGRLRGQPDGPELPHDAEPDRRGQPGAARADHRHPRGPRVRPRAARAASGSARRTTTSPRSR